MRVPYIVALVVVLAGAAIGVTKWRPFSAQKTQTEGLFFTATKGDLLITVKATGDLKAKNSIKIAPDIRGQGAIIYLIDEGTQVKKGEILAELDKTDIERQVTEMEIKVEQAKDSVFQAEEALKIQKIKNENDLEKARLDVEFAILDLEKYEAEHNKTKKEKKVAVLSAEAELTKAQDKRDIFKEEELVKRGFKTENEYKEVEFKVEEAETKLDSAQTDRNLLLNFTYPREKKEKERKIAESKRNLKMAEIKTASDLQLKENSVRARKAQLDSQVSRLDQLRDELEKMTIKAPSPGLVIYGSSGRSWERDRIYVGASTYRGRTLFTLPDVSEMQVAAAVNEVDIPRVELGQKVNISLESLPQIKPKGAVERIAALANRERWYMGNVKEFDVDITIEEMEEALKPGISAKVEIVVDTLKDVIYVPLEAVFERDGQEVCYVAASDQFIARSVKSGKSNDDFVEIKEGLEAGEKVALFSPEEGKVKVSLIEEKGLEDE